MASIRQQKMASLLQRELAIIFQAESKTLFHGAFITVTMVRVTSDMSLAKVYLSMFGVEDKKSFLEEIQALKGKIKGILGRKMSQQIRKMPDINFYIDDSLDYAEGIDNLLDAPPPEY